MLTGIDMSVRPMLIVVTFAALDLAGCDSAPPESAYTTRDSAGVAIVENFAPLWNSEAAWKVPAEPTVKIGAAEGPDEQVFHGVSGTLVANDQIVIGNESTGEIRFFNLAGDFLHVSGAVGEGPGEYRSISRIGFWRADSLFVYDRRLNRVSILSAHGSFTRSFTPPMHTQDLLPIGNDSWVGPDGSTLRPGAPGAITRDTSQFLVWDPTAAVTDTVTSIPGQKTFTFLFRGEEGYRTAPLTPSPVWTVSGDLLFVNSGEDFQVTALRQDGSIERIVRRVEEVVSATPADLSAWQENMLTQLPPAARPQFRPLFAQFPAPSQLPTYRKLLVDQTNHLWIERFRVPRGPSGEWDVFTWGGSYLGEVKIPSGVEVFQVTDDQIVGSSSDAFGVETVRAYKIEKS